MNYKKAYRCLLKNQILDNNIFYMIYICRDIQVLIRSQLYWMGLSLIRSDLEIWKKFVHENFSKLSSVQRVLDLRPKHSTIILWQINFSSNEIYISLSVLLFFISFSFHSIGSITTISPDFFVTFFHCLS